MPDNDTMLLESAPRPTPFGRPATTARRLRRGEWLSAVGLSAFVVLALFAYFFDHFEWDVAATRALQGLPVPGLRSLMSYGSYFTNPPKLTVVAVLALLACNRRSEAVGLAWSGGGSWLVSRLLKDVIARPRPSPDLVSVFHQWDDNSFPSGHVVFYTCYFGFLFFVACESLPRGSFVRRLMLMVTALPVALVGLSRVYFGEHWPSDIPGSYLLGGLWLALSLKIYHRLKRAHFEEARDESMLKT